MTAYQFLLRVFLCLMLGGYGYFLVWAYSSKYFEEKLKFHSQFHDKFMKEGESTDGDVENHQH